MMSIEFLRRNCTQSVSQKKKRERNKTNFNIPTNDTWEVVLFLKKYYLLSDIAKAKLRQPQKSNTQKQYMLHLNFIAFEWL